MNKNQNILTKNVSWKSTLTISAVFYFIDNVLITNRFVNPIVWVIYAIAGILAPITLIIGLVMLVKSIINRLRTNKEIKQS